MPLYTVMMMSFRLPFARGFAATLALVASAQAYAQTTTGTLRVAIVPRLSLVKTADLDFGEVMASASTPGTVTVSVTGARTAGGGAALAGGASSAGGFSGQGTRNQIVVFSFGAPSVTLTRVGGTQTMQADNFVLGASISGGLNDLGNSVRWRIVSNDGAFSLPVGATLRVGASQAPGIYEGTFTLTAIYQ